MTNYCKLNICTELLLVERSSQSPFLLHNVSYLKRSAMKPYLLHNSNSALFSMNRYTDAVFLQIFKKGLIIIFLYPGRSCFAFELHIERSDWLKNENQGLTLLLIL